MQVKPNWSAYKCTTSHGWKEGRLKYFISLVTCDPISHSTNIGQSSCTCITLQLIHTKIERTVDTISTNRVECPPILFTTINIMRRCCYCFIVSAIMMAAKKEQDSTGQHADGKNPNEVPLTFFSTWTHLKSSLVSDGDASHPMQLETMSTWTSSVCCHCFPLSPLSLLSAWSSAFA